MELGTEALWKNAIAEEAASRSARIRMAGRVLLLMISLTLL
jgi:hypothetical protein